MTRSRLLGALLSVVLVTAWAPIWSEDATLAKTAVGPASLKRFGPPTRPGKEEIVAVQAGLLYCQNLKQVDETIRRLARGGVNTLILRVFQNEGDRPYGFAAPRRLSGVYFRSSHAPLVDDLLGPVARIAHRQGLDVFAWMTTRHANYGFEENPGLRTILYDFEKKALVPGRGFNLFRPEVVNRLKGIYADLARYPIEGILFQDDLILRHNEGFSLEARDLFLQDHGYLPDPSIFYGPASRNEEGRIVVSGYTDRFWVWSRWKNQRLLGLAGQLMDAARRVKPDLVFATNLYYESILDPRNAMAWYSQSLEAALSRPFDYFSVMAYHRQIQEELGLTLEEALDLMPLLARRATEMVGDQNRVLIKVQVADWKDSRLLPEEEIQGILRDLGKESGASIALVPYRPGLAAGSLIHAFTSARLKAERGQGPLASSRTHDDPP
ncbi:MAG: hypothetical protein JRH07_05790 [Deltaproteobacteria bacterium]|nr:hypothetical protein [Deltaproteobacteria bacterium]